MIFKGHRYAKRKNIVPLPTEYFHGNIKTEYVYWEKSPFGDESENGKIPVYAIEIEGKGYSLTNLMYGKDGRMYLICQYLMYNGEVYSRKM